jgi:hypothetical protein
MGYNQLLDRLTEQIQGNTVRFKLRGEEDERVGTVVYSDYSREEDTLNIAVKCSCGGLFELRRIDGDWVNAEYVKVDKG